MDLDRDTDKTCLGGGMHCASASSFYDVFACMCGYWLQKGHKGCGVPRPGRLRKSKAVQ